MKKQLSHAEYREKNRALAEVFKRRADERKRLGAVVSDRVAREEAAFIDQRRALKAAHQEAMADMAGFEHDGVILEQCGRNEFTEQPKKQARRRTRRSVVHDPRVRLDDHLRDAGDRFERLCADAAQLGSVRSCLNTDPAGRPACADPDSDPDAKRARIVAALKRMRTIEAAIPRAPEVAIEGVARSQADIIRACLVEGKSLTAFAQSRKTQARAHAHALLVAALETLAALFDVRRRNEPIRSAHA